MLDERGLQITSDGAYELRGFVRNKEDFCVPKMKDKVVTGVITHVDHCGRFWLQPNYTKEDLREFDGELNGANANVAPFKAPTDIKVEQLVAAEYADIDGPKLYRAKVLKITHDNNMHPIEFKVGSMCFSMCSMFYSINQNVSFFLRCFSSISETQKNANSRSCVVFVALRLVSSTFRRVASSAA